jgi:hypothetical protein
MTRTDPTPAPTRERAEPQPAQPMSDAEFREALAALSSRRIVEHLVVCIVELFPETEAYVHAYVGGAREERDRQSLRAAEGRE